MTASTAHRRMLGHAELPRLLIAEHIMSMPVRDHRRWTLDEVERLVERRIGYSPRYELVDGELLVTPAPSGRHQRIVMELAFALRPYVVTHALGEIRLGPGKMHLVGGDRFEPDLFVLPAVSGRLGPADSTFRPLLVVEVLSPGSSRHDRVTKRRAFQREGVPEYWIVDGDAEVFEIWHPADERPQVADARLVWSPPDARDEFVLDVRGLFERLADDAPIRGES
jgi:Uma2 family endonuclease